MDREERSLNSEHPVIRSTSDSSAPGAFSDVNLRHWFILLAITIFALTPRIYGSQTMGWGWDEPGSFTLVNFDEAASCRHVIAKSSAYVKHVGWVTIGVARLFNLGPTNDLYDYPDGYFLQKKDQTITQTKSARLHNAKIKSYCHSPGYLSVARGYSAILGGLTVFLCGVLGFLLIPGSPAIGLGAAFLLAVSGFHAGQSLMATLDAPTVFFIYTLLTVSIYLYRLGRGWSWWLMPLLLYLAITTKGWPFATLILAAYLPATTWRFILHGFSMARFVATILSAGVLLGLLTNTDSAVLPWAIACLALYCSLVPWTLIRRPMIILWLGLPTVLLILFYLGHLDSFLTRHFSGSLLFHNDHGAGFAVIGSHKVMRNLINVPLSMLMGLGLLAALCVPIGVKVILRRTSDLRVWLFMLPLAAYLVFLLFIMTTTYYRHYLVLIPLAAIIASVGFWSLTPANNRWFQAAFFTWPLMLGFDIWIDYLEDPRRDSRQWYEEAKPERVFMSFYSTPPQRYMRAHRIFHPEYARGAGTILRQGQYLILSENWYDTAFPNELNGPIVDDLTKLPVTKPEYARFYRDALSGRIPYLTTERHFKVQNFMPEAVFHKTLYGTFQVFVGDIVVLRVAPAKSAK